MAFEELKQKQSVMWGTGPYQNITETLGDIHAVVLERLSPQPGERWLDLATGTGAVAERAAQRGAAVTGVDLAPALIETAKERAREAGRAIGDTAKQAASQLDEALSDGALTAKIKSKMTLDDLVNARSINVDTKDRVVTLTGTVASARERERAVALAKETKGVARVEDKLTLGGS
jgi:osmotically-inducible protein OsmY